MVSLSREAKVFSGVSILTVPFVMFGGATLLGIVTHGDAGLLFRHNALREDQYALWRAGHAHAGVWLILSLVLQILLDATVLSAGPRRLARTLAPLSAVLVSAGFFGLASAPEFQWVLYLGVVSLLVAGVLTAVGLLRNPKLTEVGRP